MEQLEWCLVQLEWMELLESLLERKNHMQKAS